MESTHNQSLNNNTTKQRVQYIDIAKGIGIMLVILSHTMFWSESFCRFFRHISTIFFMPLFFLLSGLFYRPNNIKKRLYHLFVPFGFFHLITIIVYSYPVFFKGKTFDYNNAFAFLLGEPIQWNEPLWFLISLASIVVIAKRMVNTNGLILSMLIISILVLLKPTNYYYLASTSIGLPFFIIGNICKDFFCRYHVWWYYPIAIIILITSYLTSPFPVCGVAAFLISTSWIEFFTISMLSIFIVIGVAQLIEKIPLCKYSFSICRTKLSNNFQYSSYYLSKNKFPSPRHSVTNNHLLTFFNSCIIN